MDKRFKQRPDRKTSPQDRASASPENSAIISGKANVGEILQNIDRVQEKWKRIISMVDEKFANWQMNTSNTPLPPAIQELLRAVDPVESKNGTVITYALYKQMVRRRYALWGVDPLMIDGATTGDPVTDSELIRKMIASAILDAIPEATKPNGQANKANN